jgi:hypothetical protein
MTKSAINRRAYALAMEAFGVYKARLTDRWFGRAKQVGEMQASAEIESMTVPVDDLLHGQE